MIFLVDTQELFTNDGQFIKTMRCPLASRLARETAAANKDREFLCSRCDVKVQNLKFLSDHQALEKSRADVSACFFATEEASNIIYVSRPRAPHWYTKDVMDNILERSPGKSWPLVRTARTEDEMNFAIANGYHLIYKKSEPSQRVEAIAVQRDPISNRVRFVNDIRMTWRQDSEDLRVDEIGWSTYAVASPESLVAAYLIPADLAPDTTVFVEDLVEEISFQMPQGRVERVSGWWAEWDGVQLNLKPFQPPRVLG